MHKKIIAIFALTFSLSHFLFAVTDAELNASFETLRENFFYSYTDSLLQHSLSADSYIGKLRPALPPHFSTSLSFAGSFIDTKLFRNAGELLIEAMTSGEEGKAKPFSLNIPKALPLPTYALSVRLGGILLPYDFGLYASILPLKDKSAKDFLFTYDTWNVGTDIRFALFQGNEVAPKISLGFGYIYSHFHFGVSGKKNYKGKSGGDFTAEGFLDMNVKTNTHTIFAQLQVSKKFVFFTPYLGTRAILHIAETSYDYAVKRTVTSGTATNQAKSNSSTMEPALEKIQAHIYAGFALNIRAFEMTLGANYNPMHNLFSVNFSFAYKQ